MLVSSPRVLAMFLTFCAVMFILLNHRRAAEYSVGQTETKYAFENSDQTVIGGGVTELQGTVVYDKFSGDTPSDIEANRSATLVAKSLLQKVREFRIRTQASYNDSSKKRVRKTLEDAESELGSLVKESFDTKKISQGVQKLRVALKAAKGVFARVPDPMTMTFLSGNGEEAVVTKLE